ncbi:MULTISPECIES: ArsR/SmtB family transcription factor [Brevibacillus]|jgi:DNA-binding transcriptional ArsR family regulator|uniref:ArsR/SmtB family transcription factor n=1 Tax=Brevibacillus TaxID=55080 RepID=UPI0007AC17DA|nr:MULTISPECIES: metalloregulator ArsR/SmtB family transcription factor [Brevibacillus]KZE49037.1 ArsR family transcriptional regulator [Brevibacillus parabrevis]MDH6353360.1 DNA-binding transcriptional ArsR family regulator [Brevibacillus sp. 1238]MDR5001601.1 metalloregulator ArsR/SmtB family transcription factor [Brevibacillus parabrevis]MED1724678.1 metalloregulator ArsR/SmtB family transcription factor [Brevibacillus parabrevis]MED2253477.1 metalloregulator ArsR/SmtB family transcription 
MDDICEIQCYDEEKVSRLKPHAGESLGVAKIFKALADDTRAKIIHILSMEDELCVCDVAAIIGSSIANTSHHLRLLRNMGLAKYRKEGKLVFYSLDDDHVRHLILAGVEHAKEQKANVRAT